MDNYTVAHDIEPPLPPEDAPAREPGIPHLSYSEPGPSTEIGRAQRMDAVARQIPQAKMVLAGIAGIGAGIDGRDDVDRRRFLLAASGKQAL